MQRYSLRNLEVSGETLYELTDSQTGARARFWPAFGNACVAAALPAPDGTVVDLLLAPDSLGSLRNHPTGSGIPILFPFPGRLPGGTYRYEGRTYTVTGVDSNGVLLHGFAKDRPWRVGHLETTPQHAELRAILSSSDQPDTLHGYPFPYEIAVSYRLDESGLTHSVRVHNRGETSMPFGYGAHPYFRIPLGPEGRRQDCRVIIPASRRWDLGRIASLAEGDRLSWEDVTHPVESGLDPRRPVQLEDRLLDDALTGLEARNGWIECRVDDPAVRFAAVMRCTDNFPTIVVYTPPNRPGLCFEPWTCPPNAINLVAQGIENTGLIVLPPGETWQATMVLTLASIE